MLSHEASPSVPGASSGPAPELRFAVVGDPVTHSLSPILHAAAFAALGVTASYEPIRVPVRTLRTVLEARPDLHGLSVTAPLKPEAAALAAEAHPLVDEVGGANTLVRERTGWRAWNTDVEGIVRAIEGALAPGAASFAEVDLIGAGATARSALVAAAQLGAERVRVLARRPEAAHDLVALGARHGVAVEVRRLPQDRRGALAAAPLVMSTLPGTAEAASPYRDPARSVLFDVAYAPWPTSIARAPWARRISGLPMLVRQAVRQSRLFTSGLATRALTDDELAAAMLSGLELARPGVTKAIR